MPRRFSRILIAAAFVAGGALVGARSDTTGLAARFAKHEYKIPMRDGVKLHTSVYVPLPAVQGKAAPLPIMLTRTPYGVAPYGDDAFPDSLGPSPLFEDGRFMIVEQDVRGRFMSEGEWVEMRPIDAAARGPGATDESTDTWDTIEWLLHHVQGHNGRVGIWGVSYPGFYAAAALVNAHRALVAVSPQAPVIDYYMGDDAYHNGAFMLAANFSFYAGFYPRDGGPSSGPDWRPFDYGTEDGYAFFRSMGPLGNANLRYLQGRNAYWNEIVEHPNYDAFWEARAVTPHLERIAPAVLTVGGWYDAEDLQGPLRVYRRIAETSPTAVNRLVMGPWTHGGWVIGEGRHVGAIALGSDTASYYRETIEFPFFDTALRGRSAPSRPGATVFDTGRNAWRDLDAWPPRDARTETLYLDAKGRLAMTAPRAEDAFDEYMSDPATPVPFVPKPPPQVPRAWMAEDQAFAAGRKDVLVYRGDPLAADLTVAGPVRVRLEVATSGTDSDFVVKVIDEYSAGVEDGLPAGFERLVRGEPFRGRFRHGFDEPQPFQPGVPDTVAFAMPDVFHTFKRGHRIVVHVQSSWFPLVDQNPQTFVEIAKATEADFHVATERIYRSAARASSVTMGVVR